MVEERRQSVVSFFLILWLRSGSALSALLCLFLSFIRRKIRIDWHDSADSALPVAYSYSYVIS